MPGREADTIFVDHFSDLSYVHLQSSTSSQETVQAKVAFEAYGRDHCVTVEHYHADNGRFADNLFLESVKEGRQTISFCAVNAHHQNGRAEKRIRELRENGRTQLLHAISRWPAAITVHLWPYAVRNANDIRNRMPDKRMVVPPSNGFLPCPLLAIPNISPLLDVQSMRWTIDWPAAQKSHHGNLDFLLLRLYSGLLIYSRAISSIIAFLVSELPSTFSNSSSGSNVIGRYFMLQGDPGIGTTWSSCSSASSYSRSMSIIKL